MALPKGDGDLSSIEPIKQFQCTFKDCNQVFDSLKDMKRHKTYSIEHDYCKKCDLDFETDLQHIIHRIVTPARHITCPMCGSDFRSKTGLDGHCETMHPRKQHIKCLACHREFYSLSEMMQHIEKSQCQITREDWQSERAERALQKEAFMERRNQDIGSYLSTHSSEVSIHQGGVTLTDESQLAGNVVPLVPMMDTKTNDAVLANINELATRISNVSTVDDPDNFLAIRNGDGSAIANDVANVSHIGTTDASLSAHRKTTFKLIEFYDNIREIYVCPGQHCRRTFKYAKDFHKHLLSPAHVGGHISCPSCLKHFNSVTALCAHMEAPSRRCNIRHSINYNQVLREVSAGLVGTGGHHPDGSVKYIMPSDEGWAA